MKTCALELGALNDGDIFDRSGQPTMVKLEDGYVDECFEPSCLSYIKDGKRHAGEMMRIISAYVTNGMPRKETLRNPSGDFSAHIELDSIGANFER
jgi:hypothetical protein